MPRPLARLVFAALALATSSAACSDVSTVPGPPTSQPPLTDGVWYMHTANDSSLPAPIASRYIGLAKETTILDSATLVVNGPGSYEERYWVRILLNGTLDRTEMVTDLGYWTPSTSSFVFTSSTRSRSFTVNLLATGWIVTAEPMLFFAGAPVTQGRYRQVRP